MLSRKPASAKHKSVASNDWDPSRTDGDGHRHGAEGNAFQVNGGPDEMKEKGDGHRHGAEGDALQVNGHPSKVEGDADQSR